MCNLRLHRIYKSVFINHVLCGEHVIMDPEHLLLIWKNSLPVLKAAFGMSTAGWAQGVPRVTLGRRQRVTPRLGEGVQLLQQTRPHYSEQPHFCHSEAWGRGGVWGARQCPKAPQQFWSLTCLFQQERDSCSLILIPKTNTGRDLGSWGYISEGYRTLFTSQFLLRDGPCRSFLLHSAAQLMSFLSSEAVSSHLGLKETSRTLWQN